jgi:hypothetical protein
MEPPAWLWQFPRRDPQWRREGDGRNGDGLEDSWCTAEVRARRRWTEARDAWLAERGLVMWGMRGLPWAELKRIRREEPHRILRRPEA